MPDERLGILVMVLDMVLDGGFKFLGRTVDAAAELLVCQKSKPSFDQVQPTG